MSHGTLRSPLRSAERDLGTPISFSEPSPLAASLKAALAQKRAEADTRRRALLVVEAENVALVTQMSQIRDAERERRESVEAQCRGAVAEARRATAAAEAALAEERSRRANAEDRLIGLGVLERELAETRARAAELARALDHAREQVEAANQGRNLAEARLRTAEGDAGTARVLEGRVAALTSQLDDRDATIASLEGERKAARDADAAAKAALTDTATRLELAERKLSEATERAAAAHDENRRGAAVKDAVALKHDEAVKRLRDEVAKQAKEVDLLNELAAELRFDAKAKAKVARDAELKLAAAANQQALLEAEVERGRQQLSAATVETRLVEEKAKRLQAQLDGLTTANAQLRVQLEGDAAETRRHKSAVEAYRLEVEQLRGDLRFARERLETLEREERRLQVEEARAQTLELMVRENTRHAMEAAATAAEHAAAVAARGAHAASALAATSPPPPTAGVVRVVPSTAGSDGGGAFNRSSVDAASARVADRRRGLMTVYSPARPF